MVDVVIPAFFGVGIELASLSRDDIQDGAKAVPEVVFSVMDGRCRHIAQVTVQVGLCLRSCSFHFGGAAICVLELRYCQVPLVLLALQVDGQLLLAGGSHFTGAAVQAVLPGPAMADSPRLSRATCSDHLCYSL